MDKEGEAPVVERPASEPHEIVDKPGGSSSTPAASPAQLGAHASFRGHRFSGTIRATGLYGGAIVSAGAFFAEVAWLHPGSNPEQFPLAAATAFVCGALVNAVMSQGRIADALNAKDLYRQQVDEMAASRRRLEESILSTRLSSSIPPAKSPNPDRTSGPRKKGKGR